MSYPDIVFPPAHPSDSRFFLEVDFLLSLGDLWRKILFKGSYWNCSSKVLSFIWNFNLPLHVIFTPFHLTCELLCLRDSVFLVCVPNDEAQCLTHSITSVEVWWKKVLVLSADMNLFKASASPSLSPSLSSLGSHPAPPLPRTLPFCWDWPMESCDRRLEGERRVGHQTLYSPAAPFPVGAPRIACVPWPKVTAPLKVNFSMILVPILTTCPCPHPFEIKNGNSSADPS